MEFCRLNERQLAIVASAARLPESAALRDEVLRVALQDVDVALRKAPVDKVQVLQGYARALADVIDLLSTPKRTSQTVVPRITTHV